MVTIKINNEQPFNAELNGTCLIVDERISFPAGFLTVSIDGTDIGGQEVHQTLENAMAQDAASTDGRYWFMFYEVSQATVNEIKLRADVDYLAVMTDIDLEEG